VDVEVEVDILFAERERKPNTKKSWNPNTDNVNRGFSIAGYVLQYVRLSRTFFMRINKGPQDRRIAEVAASARRGFCLS